MEHILKYNEGAFSDVEILLDPDESTLINIKSKLESMYELNSRGVSGNILTIKESSYVSRTDIHELLLLLTIKDFGVAKLECYKDQDLMNQHYYTNIHDIDQLFEEWKQELDAYVAIFNDIDKLSYDVIELENEISSKEGSIEKLVATNLLEI